MAFRSYQPSQQQSHGGPKVFRVLGLDVSSSKLLQQIEASYNLNSRSPAKQAVRIATVVGLFVIQLGLCAQRIERPSTAVGDSPLASYVDDGDASVAIKDGMPKEPTLFSLAHELKHHFVDQVLIQQGKLQCGDYNANEQIEKAAEVFAAFSSTPRTNSLRVSSAWAFKLDHAPQRTL